MKRFSSIFLLFSAIFLTSCSALNGKNKGEQSASSSSSSISTESGTSIVSATRNVSYIGTIGGIDPSIMMQGTHKLTLADGQFILLESTDANLSLDLYLGKHVEVRGSVQPTVEGNGGIMRVEEVTVFETTSSSESPKKAMCGGIAGIPCEAGMICVDDSSDSCDPTAGGADCYGICIPASDPVPASKASSSMPTVVPVPPKESDKSSSSSKQNTTEQSSSSTPASPGISALLEASIVLMAKQKNDDSSWTQKYCTGHTAFCISAHKNWYFKSFGATTSNLWHVEFGISAIDELHTGPIVLNLVAGSSASMNAKDGEVRTDGSDIIGFKDWTDGTHFELIADARLRDSVQIMLRSIAPYTPAE